MRLLALLTLLSRSASPDDSTFVFPQTEGASTGFAEIVPPNPLSQSQMRILNSAGETFTGSNELPTGSSSLIQSGLSSSVPDAGYQRGSAVTGSAPSSVPSGFSKP
jgi:hypothetical protein